MKKVVIITGANGGMGQVLTEQLALADYLVVMACKDLETAKPVHQALKKKTGKDILLRQIDLSSMASVLAFAQEMKASFTQIDRLLNNAGLLFHQTGISSDGFDLIGSVNYLGHYILTNELFPLFSAGTRIVSMASLSYRWFDLQENFLQPKSHPEWHRFQSYSNSKKALVSFTKKISQQWKNKGITLYCADPGIVDTPIIKTNIPIIDKACDCFFRPLINSPAQGAATMLYLCLADGVEKDSGSYFVKKKALPTNKFKISERENQMVQNVTNQIMQEKLSKIYDYSS